MENPLENRLFIYKLTIFNLSGYQIFVAVEPHFDLDPIGAADAEYGFFQKIGDAAVRFEILRQLPGFMDEQVECIVALTAANIQEKTV